MKLNKRIKMFEDFAGTAMDSSNNTAPASKTVTGSVAVDKTNVKSDDAVKKAEGEKVRADVIKDVDAILNNLSKLSNQIKEHYMINEEVSVESVLTSLKSSYAIAKCETKLGKYKKIALMANSNQQAADNMQAEFKTMTKFDKKIEAAEGEKKVKLKEARANAKTELDHSKDVNAEKLKNALSEFETELGESEANIAKDSPLGKVYFKRKQVLKNMVAEEGLENKAKVLKAMGKKDAALAAAGELKQVQQKGKDLAKAIADGEKEASDDLKDLEGVKAFLPEIEAIQKTSVAIKKIGDQADAHINKLKPKKEEEKEETPEEKTAREEKEAAAKTDDVKTDDVKTDDGKTGETDDAAAKEAAEAEVTKAKADYDNVKDGEDEKAKLQAEIKFKQAQQKKAKLEGDDELYQGLGDDIGEIMKKIEDAGKVKEESLDIDNVVENAKVEDLYSAAKGANDEGALNKAKELASSLKAAAAEELAAKTELANKISGKEVPKTIIILAGGDDESAKEGEDGYTLGNFIDKYGGGSSIVGKEDYSPIKIADEILASVDDAIASATGKSEDDTTTDDDTKGDNKKNLGADGEKLGDEDNDDKRKAFDDQIEALTAKIKSAEDKLATGKDGDKEIPEKAKEGIKKNIESLKAKIEDFKTKKSEVGEAYDTVMLDMKSLEEEIDTLIDEMFTVVNESEELPKKVKLYVGMSIADRFKALM